MVTLLEGNNTLNVSLTPIAPPVANLYGVVVDAVTGSPLQGVNVVITAPGWAGLGTYTDSSGAYGFANLTPGSYTVTFSKAGYETLVR
jgi:hypothetical protein